MSPTSAVRYWLRMRFIGVAGGLHDHDVGDERPSCVGCREEMAWRAQR